MKLPYSCYKWGIDLIKGWREDIKYWEYLYIKYLNRDIEISDRAANIIKLIKEEIKSLIITKSDGRENSIRWMV